MSFKRGPAGSEWDLTDLAAVPLGSQPLVASADRGVLAVMATSGNIFAGGLVVWVAGDDQWLPLPYDADVMRGGRDRRPVGLVDQEDGSTLVVGDHGEAWTITPRESPVG